jgi:16S rRNA (guanine527-N7)-methyltransferase
VIAGFKEAVRERADEAGVALTDLQISKFGTYYELLKRWTRTINLTSLPLEGYPSQTIDRLLIEPLIAARFFPSQSPRWIDLGTGSGSPAVPLRAVHHGGSLEMIESRERKAAFLREVVRALELEGSDVRTTRIEDFAASAPEPIADVITMRAVRPTIPILHAVAHLLKPGARFLVFGAAALAELDGARQRDLGLQRVETASLLEPGHLLYIVTRR